MTKNQLRSKVNKMVWQIAPYLGIDSQWTFTVSYRDRIEEEDTYGIAGGCEALWQYKQCALVISLDETKDYTDRDLRNLLTHELLHAALQEMREWCPNWESIDYCSRSGTSRMKHEEHVVTAMTTGYMQAFDEIFKDNNAKPKSKNQETSGLGSSANLRARFSGGRGDGSSRNRKRSVKP